MYGIVEHCCVGPSQTTSLEMVLGSQYVLASMTLELTHWGMDEREADDLFYRFEGGQTIPLTEHACNDLDLNSPQGISSVEGSTCGGCLVECWKA